MASYLTLAARRWWPALLLVVLVAGAYANSLGGAFVFDDVSNIVHNPTVRQLWPLSPYLSSARGVADFTFALNYAVHGLEVRGYHLVNIAIHALAAVVLFALVRESLGLPRARRAFGEAQTPLALAVAAIWALHPLQTQAVTYTIQRHESLMGMFFLLTLYSVLRAARSRRGGWSIAAVCFCALGMRTKQVMVVAPLVALLLDRCLIAGSAMP